MYDDEVQTPISLTASDRYYKVAKFPTRNIKTPVVLIYGGMDSLVDIEVMLKELPQHTVAKQIPSFEHLDFLWAESVDQLVHPTIFRALQLYTGRSHLERIEPMRASFRGLEGPDRTTSENEASVQELYVQRMHNEFGKRQPRSSSLHQPSLKARPKRYSLPHSPSSSTEPTSTSGDEIDENFRRLGPA